MSEIEGTGGNDRIAGTKEDHVRYATHYADARIAPRGELLRVDARRGGEGVDTIEGIAEVRFGDGVILAADAPVDGAIEVRDAANAYAWDTITTQYDASGRSILETTQWDDGAVLSVAIERSADGTVRGRTRTDEAEDAGAHDWATIATRYDAAGRVTETTTAADDGTVRERAFAYAEDGTLARRTEIDRGGADGMGAMAWAERTTVLDAQGRVASVEILDDGGGLSAYDNVLRADGSLAGRTYRDGDAGNGDDGSESWRERTLHFDEAGRVASVETINDDGTERHRENIYGLDGTLRQRLEHDGDLADGSNGSAAWNTHTILYDSEGRTKRVETINDDGTERSRALAYGLDGRLDSRIDLDGDLLGLNGSAAWRERTTLYGDSGDPAIATLLFDNGDIQTSSYEDGALVERTIADISDGRDWTTRTDTYDPDGTLIDRSYVWDDGLGLAL